ncbi:MAG: oligosaccharide flippase family protein [Mucilaginibacter sp.]|nr:oligosaccharide flippase family protein [Mucilaginibacter sp.]
MKEFIKSFFSFGIASTIEKLIAFVLLPVYTRYFSTSEFGVIDLIQVMLGVVAIFAHLQLETSLQRYYYDYDGERKKSLISTITYAIMLLSLVLVIPIMLFSRQISELMFKTAEYSNLIKWASLQLPFTNYSMLALVILRYEKKNMQFALMVLIKVVVNVIFILVFVVWLKRGIYGVFYAQLIAFVISSIFLFYAVKDFFVYKISSADLQKSLRYAMPQFPARIGSIMLSYANRFFMVGYLTISSIGIYSLSLKLASILQLVYTAFVMAWAPFMFEQQKKPGHKIVFAQALLLTSCPVFFIVAFVSIFAKEIVQIVASKQFIDAHLYLGGLCMYFAFFIFKEIVDIGPKFTEKTKYLSYTFFLSVVINLVSLYLFIKVYGLYGVVYSMMLTNITLFIVSWLVSNSLYHIPFNIIKFVMMALPALTVSVLSMYDVLSLPVKFITIGAISTFYGFYFFNYLKDFKMITPSSAENLI